MKHRSFILLGAFVFISIFTNSANARVFSFKDRRFAPFVRGSFAQSQLENDAYAKSVGSSTFVSGDVPWNYGGEFGLAVGWSQDLFMRLGAEVIRGSNSQVKGSSSTGVPWFTLDSSVFVFNPNLAVEYFFGQGANMRMFMAGSVGMAAVTLENRYTMTAAGQAALGTPSFNEKATATAYSAAASLGLEFLFTDNVTAMFDVGYRYLPVSELKLTGPVASIAQPTGVEGDVLKNSDGTARSLNMGGLYTSLALRFYIW